MTLVLLALMLADFVMGGFLQQDLAALLPTFLIYRFIYHADEFTRPTQCFAVMLLALQDFVRFGRVGLFLFYGAFILLVLRFLRFYLLRARLLAYLLALGLLAVIDRFVIRALLLGLPCSWNMVGRGICSSLLLGLFVLFAACLGEALHSFAIERVGSGRRPRS